MYAEDLFEYQSMIIKNEQIIQNIGVDKAIIEREATITEMVRTRSTNKWRATAASSMELETLREAKTWKTKNKLGD